MKKSNVKGFSVIQREIMDRKIHVVEKDTCKDFVKIHAAEDEAAEILKAAKRAAGKAVNLISAESGIARAEIMSHFDDATGEAYLAYYESGAADIAEAIPAMVKAACAAINKELYRNRKQTALDIKEDDNDDEYKPSPVLRMSAKMPAPETATIEAECLAEILSSVDWKIRENCGKMYYLKKAGYKPEEIAVMLLISRATYFRYEKALRRAFSNWYENEKKDDALEAMIDSDNRTRAALEYRKAHTKK